VSPDPTLDPLREALRLSPDNVPLRHHLAGLLVAAGALDEAERLYRQGLASAPAEQRLRLGLADVFQRQGKHEQALVVIEDLLEQPEPPPQAQLLGARLLLQAGEATGAARHYHAAVAREPDLADPELAARLPAPGEPAPSAADPGELVEDPFVVDGKVRVAAEDPPPADEAAAERPTVTFDDVGGMEAIKEEIRLKVIHPLDHPELYRAYGKPLGGGVLLYGPPGCGKTHLARATAGEIRAGFVAVGLDQVLDMWLGESERKLHELFERARRDRPCVLFFDEVDALGASRSDLRTSSARLLVNQFLAELDGVERSNDGVLVLAATNAPWHLDAAFRRPGRFDRILFVPPPDAAARAAILRIHCRGKPLGEVDYERLAARANGLTGADLKAVVDLAVEAKLREAIRVGVPRPLTTRDLAAAAKKVKPSTRDWFASARNYATYANQAGLYDDVLAYLEGR
jgi:SpoVK/Ycf46/Vps4 family AAA+-type ATPase